MRPGLYTGILPVTILADGVPLGRVAFEVRSYKLDYLSHYRWMLRDIAEVFSEIVMERFAPTEQRFGIDETRDAATLYQRFAFLRELITGEAFEASVHQILARPHRAWVVEEEIRRPGQGVRATSAVARQLGAPGPRLPWEHPGASIRLLPAQLRVERTEETLDTPENRFIKFAFTRWLNVMSSFYRALERETPNEPIRRGLREITAVSDWLEALLSKELFREVGALNYFPAGSQVLHKREGYRDVFRAYVQFEAAARLSWQGGEDVYGAGQRDVATLYEFWVFLKLAEIMSKLCQGSFDQSALFDIRADGLGVGLHRGQQKVLSGALSRYGRKLRVELWFNRTFSSKGLAALSWTRPMRPDCSVLVRSEESTPVPFEPVWLHFDAKYRVESLADVFGAKPDSDQDELDLLTEEQEAEKYGSTKRADLLKMHAYRDAIRRSAGAYVIYPGTEREDCLLYHEILPGLGAFALRPTEVGEADGAGPLAEFINDVVDHVASQVTQHERERFWVREVYKERPRVESHVPAAAFLTRPPADTLGLLGYVRSKDHLQWIHRNLRYNLRADRRTGSVGLGSKELAVDLVLLYGPVLGEAELWRTTGVPELTTRAQMLSMGYPRPGGDLYYCIRLKEIPRSEWPVAISRERVESVRAQVAPAASFGAPVTVTWLDIVGPGVLE
ncbi:MAG: restriction endonuclease-like protein [Actinobacteria bacterium]|nr:restriction endonuclease-like protein [Actinomycetota bacterium]